MEIEGMIVQVFEPLSGQSKTTGNTWKKREYVLETPGQYPRKVKFDVWGEKSDTLIFEVGKSYIISVDVESRMYNDRWYTDVKAYAARPSEQISPAMSGVQPYAAPSSQPSNPFGPQGAQFAQPQQQPFGNTPDFSDGDSQDDLPF